MLTRSNQRLHRVRIKITRRREKKVLMIDQIPLDGWHISSRYLKLAKLGELKDENLRYPLVK